MKKLMIGAICSATACLVVAACVDYSDPKTGAAEGGATIPPAGIVEEAGPSPSPPAPLPDGGSGTCESKSYRGGSAGVVCPGTAKCECPDTEVCCMQRIDSQSGSCVSLAACRDLALQCDGPEDCGDGGVCCLEDRTGGGSSCKSGSACGAGQWLCRTDSDCANSPSGPRCAPLDLGTPGVDDVGLDGIVGVCGK